MAALLLAVVNTAGDCAIKLRKGFIEPIDAANTRKKIMRLQVEILQIDNLADEALDGEAKNQASNDRPTLEPH